jgi:transposase
VLSRDEDVEAHALRRRGWTVAAIARHLNRDPRTIKAHLDGTRVAGVRRRFVEDPFEPFAEYCRIRLAEDPHLWASVLRDEIVGLGYGGGYSTFTRALRRFGLRPVCQPCQSAGSADSALIDHPAGEETQFDWVELPNPPAAWGLTGKHAHLLVGALSHSGRWRGVLAETEDFGQLVAAIDALVRRLGGVTHRWRFDRMATVFDHSRGEVAASFAAAAKYYGAGADVCPPRRGQRKGVVEKANHSAAQRWWRTLPEMSMAADQARVDAVAAQMDGRRRRVDGIATTVGALADAEPLAKVPSLPFPAVTEVTRTVLAQGMVPFEGNFYSVPPGMPGRQVTVRHRLGSPVLHVVAGNIIVAEHERARAGAGRTIRDSGHVRALEKAVLAAFTTAPPCPTKVRRPPGAEAQAEAARLRGEPVHDPAVHVVIDLSHYVAVADRLRRAPETQTEDGLEEGTP